MLNFARRYAEKIEIKKEKNPINGIFDFFKIKNIEMDGVNPKDTMSARESSSLPILLFFFIILEVNPSK